MMWVYRCCRDFSSLRVVVWRSTASSGTVCGAYCALAGMWSSVLSQLLLKWLYLGQASTASLLHVYMLPCCFWFLINQSCISGHTRAASRSPLNKHGDCRRRRTRKNKSLCTHAYIHVPPVIHHVVTSNNKHLQVPQTRAQLHSLLCAPPATTTVSPVTYSASQTRNLTTCATSCGTPNLPMGI